MPYNEIPRKPGTAGGSLDTISDSASSSSEESGSEYVQMFPSRTESGSIDEVVQHTVRRVRMEEATGAGMRKKTAAVAQNKKSTASFKKKDQVKFTRSTRRGSDFNISRSVCAGDEIADTG